jgi:hypothetical protein
LEFEVIEVSDGVIANHPSEELTSSYKVFFCRLVYVRQKIALQREKALPTINRTASASEVLVFERIVSSYMSMRFNSSTDNI